jgi:transposase
MEILSREAIEKWIIPYLPIGRRGFQTTVPLYSMVQAILYRLKTGCRWRLISLKQFLGSWNSVYAYFNRW